jgi:hypothetical protein
MEADEADVSEDGQLSLWGRTTGGAPSASSTQSPLCFFERTETPPLRFVHTSRIIIMITHTHHKEDDQRRHFLQTAGDVKHEGSRGGHHGEDAQRGQGVEEGPEVLLT